MRVGILGSGLMGGKLGTIFSRAGREVVFSYARSKDKLNELARDAGGKARAGTPRDAAQDADHVPLTEPGARRHVEISLSKTAGTLGEEVQRCAIERQRGRAVERHAIHNRWSAQRNVLRVKVHRRGPRVER